MSSSDVAAPIALPGPVRDRLEAAARALLRPKGLPRVDFMRPAGEPALTAADSVAWRVQKNPVALFIGGVSAVILELSEPRVRTGVWDHTSFRTDPAGRLRRTGLASQVSTYGARSVAEPMIARVCQAHARIRGQTPAGRAYAADDPELLLWVQATACFAFLESYSAYVRPLGAEERRRYFREGGAAARLYGVPEPVASDADVQALFARMRPELERSQIVFDFLRIMRTAPLLPSPLRPLQGVLIRAAIEITPAWARELLGLDWRYGPTPLETAAVRRAGAVADRIVLDSSPAVQACRRMGLPADYLYS